VLIFVRALTCTFPPNVDRVGRFRACPRFVAALSHGADRDAGRAGHHRYATPTDRMRLAARPQPALPLVHRRLSMRHFSRIDFSSSEPR
jgi:hypothetical protein